MAVSVLSNRRTTLPGHERTAYPNGPYSSGQNGVVYVHTWCLVHVWRYSSYGV